MIKRISYHEGLNSFWIEKAGDHYTAYKTFKHAMMEIESPSIMLALGQNGLKAAYNAV